MVPLSCERPYYTISRCANPFSPRSDSSQYGFGIARQSNVVSVASVEVLPVPMLSIAIFSSGNPRLYEKDVMVTIISNDLPMPTLVRANAAEAA